jgi:hypothetical protein
MDQKRVNQGIRDCLQQCYGASDVIPIIAGFIARLTTVENWDADEIRAVGVGVHKVLHGIVDAPFDPVDATDLPA